MKRFLPLVVVFLGLIASARAQGPDEQYIQIYNLMQQAEGLKESGQDNAALQKYLEAESSLRKFKTIYPDWNPRIVDFRLKYLTARIGPLTQQREPSLDVELTAPPRPGESATEPAVDYATRAQDLEGRVQQLEAEKVVLESKLKEALSVQPAVTDPAELDRARQRVTSLTEENNNLKSELEAARQQAAQKVDPAEIEKLTSDLAEANRKLAEQLEVASTLQQEKQLLQQQLESSSRTGVDSEALDSLKLENDLLKRLLAEAEQKQKSMLESAQQELESARRRIDEQNATITRLQSQPRTGQATTNTVDANALNSLRAENQTLRQQLADAELKLQAAQRASSGSRPTGDAAAEIATLKSNLEILQLEKTALQNRVRTLSASPGAAATSAPPAQSPETAQRVRQLESEKQDLEAKLQAASRNLSSSDAQAQQRVQQMADQMAGLRSRLEVLEARRVPYTEEELALMRKPEPALAVAEAAPGTEPARGTAELVAEAQRAFSSGNYAEAEQRYLQVLERDPNNVYTLGNLAAIQLEQGKTAEAEANLVRALRTQPDDAFCLSLLGYLKFQDNKLDEALDALGRSAKINPQSAETQNYLGIVLSHKGLRGPAETALRRAIQLKPDYASAHNNLAVIYVTQTPPMVELARWHYQKALANGHQPNQELEAMIEKAGAAPAGQ